MKRKPLSPETRLEHLRSERRHILGKLDLHADSDDSLSRHWIAGWRTKLARIQGELAELEPTLPEPEGETMTDSNSGVYVVRNSFNAPGLAEAMGKSTTAMIGRGSIVAPELLFAHCANADSMIHSGMVEFRALAPTQRPEKPAAAPPPAGVPTKARSWFSECAERLRPLRRDKPLDVALDLLPADLLVRAQQEFACRPGQAAGHRDTSGFRRALAEASAP